MDNTKIVTESGEETKAYAKKIAKDFKNGGIIALYGNLGSGKTTFVQGLAEGLGINRRIISPTFLIIRKYKTAQDSDFYHIDLYRMESESDIKGLGLSEIFENPKNIVAIEWAEKAGEVLPKNRMDIYFKYIKDSTREISTT